jgi:hypothetical protein
MAYCHAVGDFRPLAHSYPIVGKLTFVVTEHANATVTIIPALIQLQDISDLFKAERCLSWRALVAQAIVHTH